MCKPGSSIGGCYTGKLSVYTREQYWGLLYRETECGNLGAVVRQLYRVTECGNLGAVVGAVILGN